MTGAAATSLRIRRKRSLCSRFDEQPSLLPLLALGVGGLIGLAIFGFSEWLATVWNPFL